MAGAPRSAPSASGAGTERADARGASGKLALAALLLACAAPHLLRMALPVTTVADSFYAHAAWMLQQGLRPYLQFTQVAFPLAEGSLAGAFALFGHDLRVLEACHLVVVLAVAATLNAAARRMVLRAAEEAAPRTAGPAAAPATASGAAVAAPAAAATAAAARRAGIVAALAWSWSAWVVHFNLFERETWAALGTALALWALFAPAPAGPAASGPRWRRAFAVGAGLALAFCVKITALLPALGLLAQLLLRRRLRESLAIAAAWLALVGAATLLCWQVWGTPFLEQVFLFGFFRSPNVSGPLDALGRVAAFTDPLLALALAALLAWGLPRLRRPAGAPALMLLAELAFLAFASPTVWNHHLIGLAVTGALLLGGVAAEWSAALALRMTLALAVVLLAVLMLPGTYMPDMTSSPRALAPYVSGWSREGLAHGAAFLERYSRPGDIVFTLQPAISLQAGRVEFVRSIDLQSIALAIEDGVARHGLAATWASRQGPLPPDAAPAGDPRLARLGPYVARLLLCGMAYDRPLLLDGLAQREIALVVEPLPPLILEAGDLRAANYYRFEDHELGLAGWRPVDGVGRRVVRELFSR